MQIRICPGVDLKREAIIQRGIQRVAVMSSEQARAETSVIFHVILTALVYKNHVVREKDLG